MLIRLGKITTFADKIKVFISESSSKSTKYRIVLNETIIKSTRSDRKMHLNYSKCHKMGICSTLITRQIIAHVTTRTLPW